MEYLVGDLGSLILTVFHFCEPVNSVGMSFPLEAAGAATYCFTAIQKIHKESRVFTIFIHDNKYGKMELWFQLEEGMARNGKKSASQ